MSAAGLVMAAAFTEEEASRRFWAHVDKARGCWLWMASTRPGGTGQYRHRGRMQAAHRVAWELTYGSPPQGFLRSTCGNQRCVKPAHRSLTSDQRGPRNLTRPAAGRFEAMVAKGRGCWLWTGSTTRLGYGQFRVVVAGRGSTMVPAHRYALECAIGPIPPDRDVLHVCGNRRCVRPDHLVVRDDEPLPPRPTLRELEVLACWDRHGGRYGSVRQAAQELGIAYQTCAQHLYELRRKLDVVSNAAAVSALDQRDADWRRVGSSEGRRQGPLHGESTIGPRRVPSVDRRRAIGPPDQPGAPRGSPAATR